MEFHSPKDLEMAVGWAGKVSLNGIKDGGGRQYQILNVKPDENWFPKNTITNIDNYINAIQTPMKK